MYFSTRSGACCKDRVCDLFVLLSKSFFFEEKKEKEKTMMNRKGVPNLVGVASALAVTAIGGHFEEKYSNVDNVVASYVSNMLANVHRTQTAASTTTPSAVKTSMLLQAVKELDTRLDWSLMKHRTIDAASRLFQSNQAHKSDDEFESARGLLIYRLEWMKANLRSVLTDLTALQEQTQNAKSRNMTYEQEASILYDSYIEPSYFDKAHTEQVHARLDALLPKPNKTNSNEASLFDRHTQYMAPLLIPKQKYKGFFCDLVDSVMLQCIKLIPELATAKLHQEYIDDPKETAEAYVTADSLKDPPRQSRMVVNIARAITYDKAQQLAVHELTHFVQAVLMEDYLYPSCPEFRVAPELGPMGIVLEGGAEFFVQQYYDGSKDPARDRRADLETRVPHHILARPGYSPDAILAIEDCTWSCLWSTCIRIARDLHNDVVDQSTAERQLQEEALKRADSWPNVHFFEQVGAYSHGYGYGRELIHVYCQHMVDQKRKRKGGGAGTTSLMEEYIRFMKRPLTPGQIRRIVGAKKLEQHFSLMEHAEMT